MTTAVTTTAWFHCFNGIAGDMALGACFDAGAPVDEVTEILGRLPVSGWKLSVEETMRGGLAATRVVVLTGEQTVTRTYGHIAGLIAEARLPERVADRAGRVFLALAEAEGRLHRRPVNQVHFHEVGSLDAIVDIVGTCAALETLGVDAVYASEVAVGTGMIRAAHGLLPNPPPAVVDLLATSGAPTFGVDVGVELTTPTGAALLAGLCSGYGPLPPLRLRAAGFGAGSRELDATPNVVHLVLGEAVDEASEASGGQPLALLEANLDDVSGEVVAYATEVVLAAGALDAWTTAVTMKKGRPGVVVALLCTQADAPRLRDVLAAETGTLGVRRTMLDRWPYARSTGAVEVEGMAVRVKRTGGRVKVEYDDAAVVARRAGLPLREVLSRAEAEARTHCEDVDPAS
ncbi:MAG: nickel pincer cofactor biosynthesis protein LarC [Acidimicrobiia bacterium]